MSYTALYRKWRPAGFEDVKGQDHIVQTLKNLDQFRRRRADSCGKDTVIGTGLSASLHMARNCNTDFLACQPAGFAGISVPVPL